MLSMVFKDFLENLAHIHITDKSTQNVLTHLSYLYESMCSYKMQWYPYKLVDKESYKISV